MSALISSWSKNAQVLPEKYVLPPGKRPGELVAPICKAIPVIDLGKAVHDRSNLAQQITNACQEFGLFQVINHGVSENLMENAASLFGEFFDMPAEDKASFYSEDPTKNSRVYTSAINYSNKEVHYWRDTLQHPCYPLEDNIQSWPQKPPRYQEVVGAYAMEVRKLVLRILDLICEGLGLEDGYFGNELSKDQTMVVNHYPRCPSPSLVLGAVGHHDPNLITVLQQWSYGLQVFKDEQWIGVDPLPHAFVVNVGYQLEVISNGKLTSALHRAVTNSTLARTSIVSLIGSSPSDECHIEPAKALVSTISPAMFKAYRYREFLGTFVAKYGDPEEVLRTYRLQV